MTWTHRDCQVSSFEYLSLSCDWDQLRVRHICKNVYFLWHLNIVTLVISVVDKLEERPLGIKNLTHFSPFCRCLFFSGVPTTNFSTQLVCLGRHFLRIWHKRAAMPVQQASMQPAGTMKHWPALALVEPYRLDPNPNWHLINRLSKRFTLISCVVWCISHSCLDLSQWINYLQSVKLFVFFHSRFYLQHLLWCSDICFSQIWTPSFRLKYQEKKFN